MILKAFLTKVGLKPARIFFFDDKYENAESVANEIQKIGIECHAFVYTAATSPKRAASDWNIEVSRFQYELMKQRNEYVDYFEAQELLKNHTIMHNLVNTSAP